MPYYLYEGDKAIGPFEPGDLARRPGFTKDTLVFPVGAVNQDEWKPAQAFPDLLRALKPAAAPPAASSSGLAAPAEKLILIVDDDALLRSFLEESLGSMGFRVFSAVDGIDAGVKLQAQTPDLIITDLMMPSQGGFEFVRSLQGSSSARIPIFIVTGSVLNDSTIMMIRSEANVIEVFSKPIPMTKFTSALHRTLKTTPPPRRPPTQTFF